MVCNALIEQAWKQCLFMTCFRFHLVVSHSVLLEFGAFLFPRVVSYLSISIRVVLSFVFVVSGECDFEIGSVRMNEPLGATESGFGSLQLTVMVARRATP